jgi:hypothetical protein
VSLPTLSSEKMDRNIFFLSVVLTIAESCIQLNDTYVASLSYTAHEACVDEPFYENSTFFMRFDDGAYAAVSGMLFSGSVVTTNAWKSPWSGAMSVEFNIVTECWDFKTMSSATFVLSRGYMCYGTYAFVMKHNANPNEAVYGESTPFCTVCCSKCMATTVYDVPC